MAQTSLSDLCSICYTEKPKYRCPRCSTQTCSLPCYKTHQSRASCNGKRDPATYLKKSQLATPSGIDRDYNYLKSVERSIQDAHDRDAEGAGAAREREREGAWRRYLGENGIVVERAPKGMSRQKGNLSRVTRGGTAFWTIEWVDGAVGGEREVRHHALESSAVGELWKGVLAARRKRKAKDAEGDGRRGEKKLRGSESARTSKVDPGGGESETTPAATQPPSGDSRSDTLPASSTGQPPEDSQPPHFYLLKPSTATRSHVLTPLDPSSNLTQSLKGQTVQEYPTIYVLSSPPDNLPSGFITAEDYEAQLQKEPRRRVRGGLQSERLGASLDREPKGSAEGEVDAKAILDMLKRDVRV